MFGSAQPAHRRRDDAERASTTACGRRCRRAAPPPRPPLRVDARGVRGLGGRASPARYGYTRALPAGRPRGPRGRARRRRWRCSSDERSSLPDPCLVVLIGATGSGKSTFAAQHFQPTEVISLGLLPRPRGRRRRTTRPRPRTRSRCCTRSPARRLRARAADRHRRHQRPARGARAAGRARARARPVRGRDRARPARASSATSATRRGPTATSAPHVIRRQRTQLRRSLRDLQREGFRHVFVLTSPRRTVAAVEIARAPLWTDRARRARARSTSSATSTAASTSCVDAARRSSATPLGRRRRHPRRAAGSSFVGDLRRPRARTSPDVLRLVDGMVAAGTRSCVPGNHDVKLVAQARAAATCRSRTAWPSRSSSSTPSRRSSATAVRDFLDGLVSHSVLDGGRLVVAHAGMPEALPGPRLAARCASSRSTARRPARPTSSACRSAATGRPTTAASATVVYGHTPVAEPEWLNNTINIDTGCVFGGRLTALRWPERELVSVPARAATYYEPARPFLAAEPRPDRASRPTTCSTSPTSPGKRIIQTRLARHGHDPRGERRRARWR